MLLIVEEAASVPVLRQSAWYQTCLDHVPCLLFSAPHGFLSLHVPTWIYWQTISDVLKLKLTVIVTNWRNIKRDGNSRAMIPFSYCDKLIKGFFLKFYLQTTVTSIKPSHTYIKDLLIAIFSRFYITTQPYISLFYITIYQIFFRNYCNRILHVEYLIDQRVDSNMHANI